MLGSESDSVLIGLVGEGIRQSHAPLLHQREADRQSIRLLYTTIDSRDLGLTFDDLPALLRWARTLGYRGLNVTHPFKQAVVGHLDELCGESAVLGAVNTAVFDGGKFRPPAARAEIADHAGRDDDDREGDVEKEDRNKGDRGECDHHPVAQRALADADHGMDHDGEHRSFQPEEYRLDEADIDAMRGGRAPTADTAAATHQLAREVALGRGKVSDATITQATEAGLDTEATLEIVLAAWTNELLNWSGRYGTFHDVEVLPKPQQKPHPPTWLAAGSSGAVCWVWRGRSIPS